VTLARPRASERWIIAVRERLAAADMLVCIDLPRRMLTGRSSSVISRARKAGRTKRRTRGALRMAGRCYRHLTPKYRALVAAAAASKRVHHLRWPREMRACFRPGRSGAS